MKDEDLYEAQELILGLRDAGWKSVRPGAQVQWAIHTLAARAPSQDLPSSAVLAICALTDLEEETQGEAAHALARLHPRIGAVVARTMLEERGCVLKCMGLSALSEADFPRAFEIALRLAEDPEADSFLRSDALELLADTNLLRAHQVAARLVDDPDMADHAQAVLARTFTPDPGQDLDQRPLDELNDEWPIFAAATRGSSSLPDGAWLRSERWAALTEAVEHRGFDPEVLRVLLFVACADRSAAVSKLAFEHFEGLAGVDPRLRELSQRLKRKRRFDR